MIKKLLINHPIINPFNYSFELILRIFSSFLRPKPVFLIVGVQKSGTTTLFEYMCQHPKIKKAYREKTEKLTDKYKTPITHHASNYPFIKNDEITGDVRQDYSFIPNSATTLKKILPNVKPIFILREPKQRSISHYNMNVSSGKEIFSIEDAFIIENFRIEGEWDKLKENPNHDRRTLWNYSYQTKSRYSDYIYDWVRVFPDMLILHIDDLINNPQTVLSEVFSYLQISDHKIKPTPHFYPNV